MQFAGKKNPRHAYAWALHIVGLTPRSVSAKRLRELLDSDYQSRHMHGKPA